jgi:signal transduction histidine kinase
VARAGNTDGIGRPLRGRIRTAILAVTGGAVLLFAIPLGFVVFHSYRSQAITSLQRDATRVTTVVPDTIVADGGPVPYPRDLSSGLVVGVYTPDGHLVTGSGLATSPVAAAARDGRLHESVEAGRLAVAAPVSSDQTVSAVVRVDMAYSTVTGRVLRAWLAMAALSAVVLGLAALVAGRLARRIAGPLERLTGTARALGAGDFSVRAPRSGIQEADAVAQAMDTTAHRLGDLLDRERAFTTQVSHQLRTPLTALVLGLDSALARPDSDLATAARTAIRRAEHLEATIEDLLQLARDTRGEREELDVTNLVAGTRQRWVGTFAERERSLEFAVETDLPAVRASAQAVQQILDVLIGNALTHGAGRASVRVSDVGAGLEIAVTDEGRGLSGDPEAVFARRPERPGTHGIGLALARSLAEAEGGRLMVRRAAPRPELTLMLPSEA